MNVIRLATQVAASRSWPAQQVAGGGLRLEIPTRPGRSQVVEITMAQDGDGDAAAFVWSKAAELNAARDLLALLQLNARLTWGRVALRGQDLIVLHALPDATSDFTEVGKAIFWVARAADDLEAETYGAYTDVL